MLKLADQMETYLIIVWQSFLQEFKKEKQFMK